VTALAGLGVGGYFLATSSAGSEEFTEFYVLGPGGKAEGYPRTVDVGQEFTLILGIVNHEGEEASYRVQVTIAGRLVATLDSLQLANKEKWERTLTLSATQPGSDQKLEFVLYRGDRCPHRTLHPTSGLPLASDCDRDRARRSSPTTLPRRNRRLLALPWITSGDPSLSAFDSAGGAGVQSTPSPAAPRPPPIWCSLATL
jgi:hypothetical protein